MADELPPEGSETGGTENPPETPAPETPEGEGSAPPVEEGGEGEPGGSSPEQVFARKEYRTRRKVEADLERERLDKARLEGELKALKEAPPKAKESEPKRPTIEEAIAAMKTGELDVGVGAAYIAKLTTEQSLEAREKERRVEEQKERPLRTAQTEIDEYLKIAPYLKDDHDERTKVVFETYQSLVRDYGLPEDVRTKALAVKQNLGTLEKLRKQREVSNLTGRGTGTHVEQAAGGNGQNSTQAELSKAPTTMQAYWSKAGLTEAQRKKELEIYNRLVAQGK